VISPSRSRTKPRQIFPSEYDPVIVPRELMLVGFVATEPGGSMVMNLYFSAFAERLSPSVQKARRERTCIAFW
jgi:hypothetical protein